ncbi:MAG: YqaA family protein [Candidatus Competibacterales bacterium]|nr:YqaA family protein [Candidatus Competibacterales bacterium]
MTPLLLMFVSAFGAATILPFYSEAVLVGYLAGGEPALALWASATLGNTLGSVVNWWLGLGLTHWSGKRWFPASPKRLEQAQRWFQRYGVWSLLLAWAPIGGDALTFIGGLMRVKLPLFVLLVGTGKGLRYAAIIAAYMAAS